MPASAAKKILDLHWDRKLPVDPVRLARSAGVRVQAEQLRDCSGKFHFEGNTPTITVNSEEPKVRQRFTVAHELGHWALRHGPNWRDAIDAFAINVNRSVEREANAFAAELLMPEEALRIAIENRGISDLPELSKIFGVSQVAMQYRLKNLGYI